MKKNIFRAKHIHVESGNEHLNGIWVEGYLCAENYINSPGLESEFLVDPKTVGQYTGLVAYWEDYEKEVWEHDLLQIEYENKEVIAEVMYDAGMFILVSKEFSDGYIPLFDVVQLEDEAWVVAEHKGNIFDNPELLEVAE